MGGIGGDIAFFHECGIEFKFSSNVIVAQTCSKLIFMKIIGNDFTVSKERSPAVQVIFIFLHLLMSSVDILMTAVPTKPSLALRILWMYFVTKPNI
jgi:hypothetical protein